MTQKYIFQKEDQQPEEVALERWAWAVIYKNGEEFKQFDDNGFFHQVGEIDQDNVKLLVLYKPDNPNQRIDIIFNEGMRVIHKYKNIVLQAGSPDEQRIRIYVIGYKAGNKYHLNFVLPDDRIIQTDQQDIIATDFDLLRGTK